MLIPEGGDWEYPAREAKLEKARRKRVMEDVRNEMEAHTEEAAQLKKAEAAVRKTRSGNMRGAIQTLTGEGVAEGDDQSAVLLHLLQA